MKNFISVLAMVSVAVLWCLGDAAFHGLGPLSGVDTQRRFEFILGAGAIGLLLGLMLDPAPTGSAFGPTTEGSGIRGLGRWSYVTIPMVFIAAGAGWLVEVYVRHLVRGSELALWCALWDATGMFAIMSTLLRDAGTPHAAPEAPGAPSHADAAAQ